jgi:hypothetical protein
MEKIEERKFKNSLLFLTTFRWEKVLKEEDNIKLQLFVSTIVTF